MKMPMRIDVIERQSGGAVGVELRGDFGADLPPDTRSNDAADAVADEIVAQTPRGTVERWNLRARGERIVIDQNDVKPDAQPRQFTRASDGVGRGRSADHETCGAENAAPVRLFDRGIDRFAEPEIVRRYRQPIQCADSRRSRRNEKNSSPSRRRRRIISGLRTISEAIAAIFGARK